MNGPRQTARAPLELLDSSPRVDVEESEYRRLLGYPKDHDLGERPRELSASARRWYAEHGRPWVYVREADLQIETDTLRVGGTDFRSKQLHDHLQQAAAQRVMLVAVSAGRECEEHARQLWQESKPDEYFFLEMFGSAVVEHLVATLSGRICDLAEREGLMAIPHYSPGYTGWDIADQNKLFELIANGMARPFPEQIEVLSSGMLRPKKSLLAIVGLAPLTERTPDVRWVPCDNCAFSPCQYRRAPYRHASSGIKSFTAPTTTIAPETSVAVLTRDARYTVNSRALRKWAQERVVLEPRDDGSIAACFRFDGTTCANQGQPLAFEYRVALSGPNEGYTILRSECGPVAGDQGHKLMCAYLSDATTLMSEIASEQPLLGRPLNDVLSWSRTSAPSGCYCTAMSREHKWGLALEAIHYTLAQLEARAAAAGSNPIPHSP
ncbi:MAG: hypothetical protein ABIO94_03775 [Opitutaceae bacterium]